jgi:hypothetical protein
MNIKFKQLFWSGMFIGVYPWLRTGFPLPNQAATPSSLPEGIRPSGFSTLRSGQQGLIEVL